MSALPVGFRVRVRDDVTARALPAPGERLLIGGSPVRALRLGARAAGMLDGDVLDVRDDTSAVVARRLLDANIADPEAPPAASAKDLTVVVPVRDRPEQLDRCLAALTGLEVIVVDDASLHPAPVHAVVRRHGAHLVALLDNVGPAAARNRGLAEVATPYVAFIDSDVTVDPATLLGLAGHLADPALALLGPLVRGVTRSPRPRWFERYDAAASSLALGEQAASVQIGARVAWLPSACLVGRTGALHGPNSVNGFDPRMRVGEDVDLVWRLLGAGWRVRYEPSLEARHDVRPSIRGWLGRKVVYGVGGAPLAQRHGQAVAVARLSPLMAAAGAGILLRRPWSLALAVGATAWAARSVRRSLPEMEGRSRTAARLAVEGLGWSVRQQTALLLRHWWPAAALGCLLSARVRRAVATALVVDTLVAATVDRPLHGPGDPRPGLAVSVVGRRLDDLAYGAGLWIGAARHRSWGPLRAVLAGSPEDRCPPS